MSSSTPFADPCRQGLEHLGGVDQAEPTLSPGTAPEMFGLQGMAGDIDLGRGSGPGR